LVGGSIRSSAPTWRWLRNYPGTWPTGPNEGYRAGGKLATADRPALLAALDHVREGDLPAVQEVDRLGRNLLEGLIVLNDLFQRGVGVKVFEGIAAGEHIERSLILDLALAWQRTVVATSSGGPRRAAGRA
jgi:hypothetical protein